MKTTKRIFALVLALVMMMGLATTAFAAEKKGLFIEDSTEGRTYEAYQIFSGSLSADGATLSDVKWGSSVKDGNALVAALLADTYEIETTQGKVTLGSLFSVLSTTDDDKKAAKLAELLGTVSNNSSTLDRFAEVVGKVDYTDPANPVHVYLQNPVTQSAQSTKTIDGKSVKGYAFDLDIGYYLVKDKELTQNKEGGYYTKYIIRLVNNIDIKPKGAGVTLDKTINDTVNGTFGDVEDFDVGDSAYYKLEGTLPSNLSAYDEYNYKFVDKLPKQLTFEKIEQIYIEGHDGNVVHTFFDVTNTSTADDVLPAGITVTVNPTSDDMVKLINGQTVGTLTYATVTGQDITVEFNDLLAMYPSLLNTQKVIVKYSALVTKEALISDGSNSKPMTNKAHLEYDNNPNGEGTGKTVSDEAHAFTFTYTVDKYDMADPTKKLENVEFLMYYTRTENDVIVKYYAQVVTEEIVAAHQPVNGKIMDAGDVGLVYDWTTDRTKAAVLDTDANGAFKIHGLDGDTYYLEEITTNDGYNLLDTPVQIDIVPTFTVTGDTASVTVEYSVDNRSQGANNVIKISNSKGAVLPSTGGVGTTMFYIAGGLMVALAVVLLVTKKRMAEEQ